MAFASTGHASEFKTHSRGFTPGYGIVIRLDTELPQRYEVSALGSPTDRGVWLHGSVKAVLGARGPAPQIGASIAVHVRPSEQRQGVFADLLKTNEGFQFLLEGVSEVDGNLQARWAHGAGTNRAIQALEIVGPPHVTFQNPIPDDGPRSGWLRLNLDGSPTPFEQRATDGSYSRHELHFDTVVQRLRTALDRNMRFRVSQRVLAPSQSIQVNNQKELNHTLTVLRAAGFTSCIGRTFIPGTADANEVDVQVLTWPHDVPANAEREATVHERPSLQETTRFKALRDAAALAHIEIIPGYVLSLIGNTDTTKSTKHTFVRNIVKGLSDGQKSMYATQNYGPGIAICALSEEGTVTGLARLALRTEGVQYRNILTIPTPHFTQAYRVKSEARKEKQSTSPA